jgi:hypothetical protein
MRKPRRVSSQIAVGDKYNYLTIMGIHTAANGRGSNTLWTCQCVCGKIVILRTCYLGIRKSCGCSGLRGFKDLSGKTFGYWKVIRYQNSRWLCECKCGTQRTVKSQGLRSGRSTSCGCNQECKKKLRKPNHIRLKTTIYNGYRHVAKARGLEFLLSKEQVDYLTTQSCKYCGISPRTVCDVLKSSIYDSDKFRWNGIDRIDNTRGYTIDNAVPCCTQCNRAKLDQTYEQFMEWARRLYLNSNETNNKTS